MRKLVCILTLVLVVTLIFGIKIAPFVDADSFGKLDVGAELFLTEDIVDLSVKGVYDVPAKDLYLDGLLTLKNDIGSLKVKGSYETTGASPTIGFLATTSPLKLDVFSIYGIAGTGDFRNNDFGNKVLGDLLADNKALSVLGGAKLGLGYTWFDLSAKLEAGYFIKAEEYQVAAIVDGKLFTLIDVKAMLVLLPEFSWSVFAQATFEF